MCQNCVNPSAARMVSPDDIVRNIADILNGIDVDKLPEEMRFRFGILANLVSLNNTVINLCLRGGDVDAASQHASMMLALGTIIRDMAPLPMPFRDSE